MPIVFKGRVFAVEVSPHRFPDGKEREITVVRHRTSVVLLPMLEDGRVLLIRQYRASVGRLLWEIPAGSCDDGESPDLAAARECEEETGLRPGLIERVRSLFPAPGFCDEQLVFYRVSQLAPPPADSPFHPDEDEDIEVKAVSLDEARRMVERGEIEDLKTAYGLTLV